MTAGSPSIWERLEWDTREIRASDARAEQKASILLGIAIGSLALSIGTLTAVRENRAALVLGALGAFALLLSTAWLVLAVRPNIGSRSALRDISWTRLTATKSAAEALAAVINESDHGRQLRIAELNRILAIRVRRKHLLILPAVWAMLAALPLVALAVAFFLFA